MKKVLLFIAIVISITSCHNSSNIDFTHIQVVDGITSYENGTSDYHTKEFDLIHSLICTNIIRDSTGKYKIKDTIPLGFMSKVRWSSVDSVFVGGGVRIDGGFKYYKSESSTKTFIVTYKVTICGDTVEEVWRYRTKQLAIDNDCFGKDCY